MTTQPQNTSQPHSTTRPASKTHNDILQRFANACIDWLYPPTCMACKILLPLNDPSRTAIWLCETCESLLEPSPEPHIAPFKYEGILRDIIRDIKFRHRKNHARALGRLWAKHMTAPILIHPPTEITLVPMPLHRNKQRARGFNQAELLTQELARSWGLPMEKTLIRIIDTPPQAGLHPARRIENVSGAFAIAPGCVVTGKKYVLIDDIYTTGASINECVRTLMSHGAADVQFMTLTQTAKKAQDAKDTN